MSLILLIVYILLSLVALILVIAIFSKKEYSILRQIQIHKPKAEVFHYIKHLRNQDNYSKWVMMDPNVKKTFRGIDGQPGFVATWDSTNKQVGKGEQEITKISDGERIDYEIRFEKPFRSVSPAYLITEAADNNATHVKWGFEGKMSYPMNALLLFVNIPELLGKDLDESLGNLKSLLENESSR
jgi:hypothetical protein